MLGNRREDTVGINTSVYVTMPAGGGAPTGAFASINDARVAAFGGAGPVAVNPVINRYVAAS